MFICCACGTHYGESGGRAAVECAREHDPDGVLPCQCECHRIPDEVETIWGPLPLGEPR